MSSKHIKIPGKYDVNEKARKDVTQWRKLSQWRQGFEHSCRSEKVNVFTNKLKIRGGHIPRGSNNTHQNTWKSSNFMSVT